MEQPVLMSREGRRVFERVVQQADTGFLNHFMRSAASTMRQLVGKEVQGITLDSGERLTLGFSDGTVLQVSISAAKLTVVVSQGPKPIHGSANTPTKRQREYLRFIAKYMQRFGRAPAESDIERHFLVSAPSVNQMMQTLERRGFISRQSGVPRSTRICVDPASYAAP